jgi:hypothetical protein
MFLRKSNTPQYKLKNPESIYFQDFLHIMKPQFVYRNVNRNTKKQHLLEIFYQNEEIRKMTPNINFIFAKIKWSRNR